MTFIYRKYTAPHRLSSAGVIFFFILLLSFPANAQLYRFSFEGIEDDSLDFFTSNIRDHDRIAPLVNGIKVSGLYNYEYLTEQALDKVTQMPIWSESRKYFAIGGEIDIVLNPIRGEVGGILTQIDFYDWKRHFAMPPLNPDLTRTTVVKVFNFYGGVSVIPALFFWGYVYPTIGVVFYGNYYEYYGEKNLLVTVGATADINIEYNYLFASAGYRRYFLNTEYFTEQIKLQAGFRIPLR